MSRLSSLGTVWKPETDMEDRRTEEPKSQNLIQFIPPFFSGAWVLHVSLPLENSVVIKGELTWGTGGLKNPRAQT